MGEGALGFVFLGAGLVVWLDRNYTSCLWSGEGTWGESIRRWDVPLSISPLPILGKGLH